jgi:acyl-CoA synthetase (AMP-forming)/AMP-acid ligase II
MAPSADILHPSLPSDTLSWKGQVKIPQASVPSAISNIERRYAITIDELIRRQAEEEPSEPIVSYPSSEIDYVDYTFRQLDFFASLVAHKYKSIIPQRASSSEPEIVFGLLGPSNFEYFISILALTKLGHTVLFLSTRISPAAYTSLLQATGAQHILMDESFRDIVEQVKEGSPALQVHTIVDKAIFDFPIMESDIDTCFDQ